MTFAPQSHTLDRSGSAEVVAIPGFVQPTLLTGRLAGVLALRLGTITLASCGSRVRNEKPAAAAAFSSGHRAAHRAPKPAAARFGRKSKKKTPKKNQLKKEEELCAEGREENAPEENGFSNRQLYTTFISPLTFYLLSEELAVPL